MEKIFDEILNTQIKEAKLSSERALFIKATYLVFTLLTIIYPKPCVFIILIFIGIGLLLCVGLYRTLIFITLTWMMTSLLLISINIAVAYSIDRLIHILLYVYASILSIVLFVSTTSPKQLYRLTGLNPLSLTYLMLRNVIEEIRDIVIACKSRGWEPGLNPIKYVKLLGNVVVVMGYRLRTAEESVKSRGLD